MNCDLGASDQNLFNSGLELDQDWFCGQPGSVHVDEILPVLVTVSMARFHLGTISIGTLVGPRSSID